MSRRHLDCHGNLHSTSLIFTEASSCLLFKLIGLLVFLNATLSCPFNCDCHMQVGLLQCQSLTFQEIPGDLPGWVQNLSITSSNITFLQASTFRWNGTSLYNLTTLVLTNDNLQAIEEKAFLGLPSLTTLDLSFNALTYISDDAFVGLSHLQVLKLNQALGEPSETEFLILNSQWAKPLQNLKTLEITGNELQSLPMAVKDLESLQTIYLGNNSIQRLIEEEISVLREKKIRVYLSPNPIFCDCKIKDMLLWFRNTSRVVDANQLQCSSPLTFNGTLVISHRGDSLKCNDKNLETASYVFFGIVLALIGVIFLMVLYLNRRGIKRWLNNFREACRDQMEGYHYRYEQDSDPRRSNASSGI
ncbi:trophoblast glycoprotein-like [Hyperolius riggenbachi]|uniref:trophoblast glycoprotein-like n=1 Tax=Hyperolius riggenbachi TaxID=752182 RepID=UPI0035A29A73